MRPLALVVGLAALAACKPRQATVPAEWTPVPLAQVVVPPGTPCADGLRWLYSANCTGQTEQPICRDFATVVQLFAMPAQGVHCDLPALAEAQELGLRFAKRSQERAPPEMQNDATMRHRTDDQRLYLLDGFLQGVVEQAAPRPGQEAEVATFRARYRPTDFSKPLPRPATTAAAP